MIVFFIGKSFLVNLQLLQPFCINNVQIFTKVIKIGQIMKSTIVKTLAGLLTFCVLATIGFMGCKEESEDITAVITVKYQSDTTIIVPFADVTIGTDYDDVRATGKTDATGMFTTTFKLEAILDVVASKDTNTGVGPTEPPVTGQTMIRLRPGETVYKTVYVN
jgi:hypothetical protein